MKYMDTKIAHTKIEIGGSVISTPNQCNNLRLGSIIKESAEISSINTENFPNEFEKENEDTQIEITTEEIAIENLHINLANNIWQGYGKITPSPSHECCIYRVPRNIRKLDEEAYTPEMVSIGPYHRDEKRYKFTEEYKSKFLKNFIERSGVNMQQYVKLMKESEERARASYVETLEMSSDEFVTMMLVDGCFILELMLQESDDSVYITSKEWLMNLIIQDMILLENQIPFFILQRLFNLAFPPNQYGLSFLFKMIHIFLSSYNIQKKPPNYEHVKHFTDLIRYFYLPKSKTTEPSNGKTGTDLLYNATQLKEAGVKFKAGSKEFSIDVTFTNGVLEFPRLTLFDETKCIFRNLVALEHCHYPIDDNPIIDYVIFLDHLIDTPDDVNLLVKNGMLCNCVGSSSVAADIINKLGTNVVHSCKRSYLLHVCKELNAYYNRPRNRWRATLVHDYFRSPWRTASTIAAILLLVLTSIQTICSVLSIIPGRSGVGRG